MNRLSWLRAGIQLSMIALIMPSPLLGSPLYKFNVATHSLLNLDQETVDVMISDATYVLSDNGGATGGCYDMTCCIRSIRDGSVVHFDDAGWYDIQSLSDAQALMSTYPQNWFVIHRFTALGADPVGLGSQGVRKSVVDMTATPDVWAHELGHNVGLIHDDSCPNLIMNTYWNYGDGSQYAVTSAECNAYATHADAYNGSTCGTSVSYFNATGGPSRITLDWNESAPGESPVYYVSRADNCSGQFQQIAVVPSGDPTYTPDGSHYVLVDSTATYMRTYSYLLSTAIEALNASAQPTSGPPVGISLAAFRTAGSVDSLVWTDAGSCPMAEYYVQRSLGNETSPVTIDSTSACIQFKTVTVPFGNTIYYYRIVPKCNPSVVSNFATVGGNVDVSQTIAGDLYASGDVVVTTGKTLTLLHGVHMRVAPHCDSQHMGYDASKVEFQINGSLRAIGWPSDTIRIESAATVPAPGDWRGLRIDSGANYDTSSALVYVAIRHADHGLQTSSSPKINHSRIQHSQIYGIYVQHGAPKISYCVLEQNHGGELGATLFAQPDLDHCYLRYDPSLGSGGIDDGVSYNTYAGGRIRHTTITGVGMGVYCVGIGANPYLKGIGTAVDSLKYGRNNILDFRTYGIRTYDRAWPDLGSGTSSSNYLAGRNNIYTTVSATAPFVSHSDTTMVNARYNYWGASHPDLSRFSGNIDGPQLTGRYLTFSDPSAGAGFQPTAPAPISDNPITPEDLYDQAVLAEFASDPNADADYRSILKNYPGDPVAARAAVRLFAMICRSGSVKSSDFSLADSLEQFSANSEVRKVSERMLPALLLQAGRTSEAIAAYDALLSSKEFDRAGVLLEVAIQKGLALGDVQGAKDAIAQLQECCYDVDLLKHARAMLEGVLGQGVWISPQATDQHPTSETTSSSEMLSMEQSAPNPMNPRTTLRFSLPRPGHVTLRIFDIRGGLVRTLVNDDLAKGAHVIVWDGHTATGQSVASGVYNYRLEALGKHLSRRLIVLK